MVDDLDLDFVDEFSDRVDLEPGGSPWVLVDTSHDLLDRLVFHLPRDHESRIRSSPTAVILSSPRGQVDQFCRAGLDGVDLAVLGLVRDRMQPATGIVGWGMEGV